MIGFFFDTVHKLSFGVSKIPQIAVTLHIMEGEIINKVATAGIEQVDLADFIEKAAPVGIDLKGLLWNELVLREKNFRDWLKQHDWNQYAGKHVYIYCSNDAIVPAWAYMLITAHLQNAQSLTFGDIEEVKETLFFENLKNWNVEGLADRIVMVKGCSSIPNPNKAYVVLTERLLPVVKSLMFGEPCSAVPVYKRKK